MSNYKIRRGKIHDYEYYILREVTYYNEKVTEYGAVVFVIAQEKNLIADGIISEVDGRYPKKILIISNNDEDIMAYRLYDDFHSAIIDFHRRHNIINFESFMIKLNKEHNNDEE